MFVNLLDTPGSNWRGNNFDPRCYLVQINILIDRPVLMKSKTFYSREVYLDMIIQQLAKHPHLMKPPRQNHPPVKGYGWHFDVMFLHMFHQKPARLFITVTFHPTTNTLKWCQTCRGVRDTKYLKPTKLKTPHPPVVCHQR